MPKKWGYHENSQLGFNEIPFSDVQKVGITHQKREINHQKGGGYVLNYNPTEHGTLFSHWALTMEGELEVSLEVSAARVILWWFPLQTITCDVRVRPSQVVQMDLNTSFSQKKHGVTTVSKPPAVH